jgi:hypothetical protein
MEYHPKSAEKRGDGNRRPKARMTRGNCFGRVLEIHARRAVFSDGGLRVKTAGAKI